MMPWETYSPRRAGIKIEFGDSFSARGMRRVFGRGDYFPGRASFNLDIWRNRKGELFGRFWSRSYEVDERSFQIHGVSPDSIPKRKPGDDFSDAWVPKILRDEYDKWINQEW